MDGEDFTARYAHAVGLLNTGRLVTIIPMDDGTLDWQEYELNIGSLEALFSWSDEQRTKLYCELLVRRQARIEG